MKKPLSEVVDIYEKSLVESDVKTNYDPDSKIVKGLDRVQKALNQDINRIRKDLGVAEIVPIELSKEKSDNLRAKIHTDSRWIGNFNELVSILEPELDLKGSHEDLYIPWWNSSVLNFGSDEYNLKNNPSLNVNFKLSHSYMDLLERSKKHPELHPHTLSITGVLTTTDDVLVVGMRGGTSFGLTYMNAPAGSIEAHTGENPIFESFVKENKEELNLTPKDLIKVGLVGRAIDTSLQPGPRSYYVFSGEINKSYRELIEIWKNSVDRNEHSYIAAFPNDSSKMLERIKLMRYDFSKAADNISKTTSPNIGSILPPCAISILTHYAQKEGKDWAKHAEKVLQGDYKLVR